MKRHVIRKHVISGALVVVWLVIIISSLQPFSRRGISRLLAHFVGSVRAIVPVRAIIVVGLTLLLIVAVYWIQSHNRDKDSAAERTGEQGPVSGG